MIDTNILDSDWLLHMLQKASNTPKGRILALFDILQDWLNAPLIGEAVSNITIKPSSAYPRLQKFIVEQANQLGVQMPQLLADQICLIAIAAIQEKSQNIESTCMHHAKLVVDALIIAQTRKTPSFFEGKRYISGIAATFVLGISLIAYFFGDSHISAPDTLAAAPAAQVIRVRTIANPNETAMLFAEIERMRHGSCQLIEAIQLPDAYKQVYFDNIVSGQISTDPEQQRIVRDLLKMVRCNYTPMLMANSTG